MSKFENIDICKDCGGYCCKKSGCDYFVSDFENLKVEVIEKALSTGRVSVVAALDFKTLNNGKFIAEPILYLRARNVNRSEIDLLSFKTTCASLTDDGCYFDLEHRPSGGSTLIPAVDKEGYFRCKPSVDKLEELNKWKNYQTVLHKIVKRHTGMNVYDRIKYDVENLFYNVIKGNFDGVSEVELKDVAGMIPMLYKAFPEEYIKAKKRSSIPPFMLIK